MGKCKITTDLHLFGLSGEEKWESDSSPDGLEHMSPISDGKKKKFESDISTVQLLKRTITDSSEPRDVNAAS